MRPTWTVNELQLACANSISIAQVLDKLNLRPAGGNYSSIKKHIAEHNIDVSHFLGQAHSRGKLYGPRKSINEMLVYGLRHSDTLRKRLLREKIKEHRCEKCLGTTWLSFPIPLELDHIDGDHKNNVLSNLRLLCPNCHAQTDTYRGKNIGRQVNMAR